MFYWAAAVIIIYSGILAFMAVFQRSMLYFPDKNIGNPETYGLIGFSEYFIRTPDNVLIQTWYKPANDGIPTILYFHGNASHMGNRAGIYSALAGKGFGVLSISYRGYGKSGGSPHEQGLYTDARTAIAFLTEQNKIPLENIILYGESLGTGVAVHMAQEYKVRALILQAPYTSVSGRAAEIYFFMPVKLVMLDHFDSLSKIPNIKSPLLIIHGEMDITIPIRHGKTLLKAATTKKEAVFFHDVGHNNFDSSAIAENVLDFIGCLKATD